MIKIQKPDNNILHFLYFLLMLTPPLAMLSGLMLGPWISIIMVLTFFLVGFNIKSVRSDMKMIDKALLLWGLLTCFWSISPLDSLFGASRLILIIVLYYVIIGNIKMLKIPGDYFERGIKIALVLSIAFFLVEKNTEGAIIGYLRGIFQPFKDHRFHLFWLDRGAAMLSVFSWVPIYLYLKSNQPKMSFICYLAVLAILLISDSDASILAYLCSAIAFGLAYFYKGKFRKIISILVLGFIFLMPAFSKLQEPEYLAENPLSLPLSHVHRLFIWKYAMNISSESLFYGKGIDASKAVDPQDSDMIIYRDIKMSPLPRHPHNNVIQVTLELGLIGLALFAIYLWKILGKFDNLADRDRKYAASCYSIFINYFVIGTISFSMWQSWWLLVILYMVLTMKLAKENG